MNAERLLALYERVAEAPDAITRLRRFILDLAVRGKLVPQDPKDEPASELLKRIAQEKARLVKAGEIKKSEDVAELTASVHHFSIPPGWAITNLQSVCNSVTDGDHLPPPKAEAGVPFLVIGNVRSQSIEFEGSRFVPQSYYDALDPIRRPRSGDLLYTLVGSYGIPIIVRDDQPFCVQRHIGILRPCALMDVNFLARTMESRFVFDQATICATGIAQKTVPLSGLRKLLLPLPPLAEQHRIVAKVDELMALCDQLEAARQERESRRDRLAAASLARLNAPDPETFQSDARFTLNALPALTTRPNQIKQLRQTILNLAVRGKLVPQDPSDESVHLDVLSETEAKVALPASWRYIRLAELLREDTRNGYSRRPDDAPEGAPILRISAGTVRRDGVVAEEEHKLISGIDAKTRREYGLRAGDLLACRFNGNKAFVGRLSIFNDYLRLQPIYPDKLIRVRLEPQRTLSAFLRLASETDLVRDEVEVFCATTVGNWGISASNLKEVRFPVPPLAEQHRIVAKVDELMALCDRLEASLTTSDQTRTRLLEATLAEALAPASISEMESAE